MADDGTRAVKVDGDAAVVGRAGRAALGRQPRQVLLGGLGRGAGREGGPEVRRQPGQLDPILRTARAGDGRRDAGEVKFEHLVERRASPGLTPQPLGLRIALDQFDPLGRSSGETQVGDRLVVDREECRGGPELGAHVADRGSIGQGEAGQPIAGEFHERADDAVGAQQFGDHQHEVGRGRAAGQGTVEADADDVGHRLVERLPEQDGLGLDPADAVAQDAEPVDHRRVRIGADERVRECDPAAVGILAVTDDGGQELDVDLVDDAGPGRHDAQVAERGLCPAQELVALAVALVFPLDVEGEGAGRPESIDLDGVVDDEVGRDQRIDLGRVTAEGGHRVAHHGQVHDRRDAGEILEQDAGRHERDLGLGCHARPPCQQRLHVRRAGRRPVGVTEQVLEQDLDRDGQRGQVDPIADGLESVDVGEARAEGRASIE